MIVSDVYIEEGYWRLQCGITIMYTCLWFSTFDYGYDVVWTMVFLLQWRLRCIEACCVQVIK